jgi:hypothetical protein
MSERYDITGDGIRARGAANRPAAGGKSTPRWARHPPCGDRDFGHAVSAGNLALDRALRHGDREAFALALQRRYAISFPLALNVADNRTGLREALRAVERNRKVGERPRSGGRLRLLAIVLLMGTAAFIVGHQVKRIWDRQLAPPTVADVTAPSTTPVEPAASSTDAGTGRAPLPASVDRDEHHQATRLVAGHPSQVLEAACRLASAADSCPWMDLVPTDPPRAGHRIGRFTDVQAGGEIRTIYIRRHPRSGQWFAGTGLRPLLSASSEEPGAPSENPDASF